MYVVDLTGRIRLWSDRMTEVGLIPADQVMDRLIWEAVPGTVRNRSWERLTQAFRGEATRNHQYFDHPATGCYAFQCVTRRPVFRDGKVTGAAVIIEWSRRVAPFTWGDDENAENSR